MDFAASISFTLGRYLSVLSFYQILKEIKKLFLAVPEKSENIHSDF